MKTIKTLIQLLLFAALTIGVEIRASAQEVLYDLTRDFSTGVNPNGPWSYNLGGVPIPDSIQFWWGATGWGNWASGDGSIMNAGPAGLDVGAHDWQPGDVTLHSLSIPYGGATSAVSIAWTAPEDGTITIEGQAWNAGMFGGRDASWILTVDGEVYASNNSVFQLYRNDHGAQFENNLLPGKDLIDIVVQQGVDVNFSVWTETYYGHFVGVTQQIWFSPQIDQVPIPETGTMLGSLLGVAFALANLGKRTKGQS